MSWNTDTRNHNLTIRITNIDKCLFNKIAWKNKTTLLNWAYKIILKHKDSYGKEKDTDLLLESLEMAIEGLYFNLKLLEEQKATMDVLSEKHSNSILLRMKIIEQALLLEKVKGKILRKENN